MAQATVRALFGEGAATLAVTRSSMTKRGTVCRTPVHLSVIVTRQNQDTREVVVRGYVGEVVISCGAEVIARHRRSYDRDDFVFDPIHYLPLLEHKIGALDQAAPLAGWELPEEFGVLRRLLESRMGRRGKREFVQVLRLMENFPHAGGVRGCARCPQARRHKLRRRQAPGAVQNGGTTSETRPGAVPLPA